MADSDAPIELIELLLRDQDREAPKLIVGAAEFDLACEHILSLLKDGMLLYEAGSFPRAAFLGITAIEETAKVALGPFLARDSKAAVRGGALYSHKQKHLIGSGPLPMTLRERLVEILGREEAEGILKRAQAGDLVALRERCLYFERAGDRLQTPQEAVDPELARSILVLALDVFDDRVVGMTHASYKVGEEATALLESLKD